MLKLDYTVIFVFCFFMVKFALTNRLAFECVYQEAVFMGNGEQYIWKPPEEDDIITLHPPPQRGDSGQGHPSPPTAKEVSMGIMLTLI